MNIKVGSRVVINALGFIRYQGNGNNPRNVVGTVTGATAQLYRVAWDNGMSNVYLGSTLSLAKPRMLENE